MTRNLIFISSVVSLAGLLIGFDLGFVSGLNLTLKELWNPSEYFDGFFILGIYLIGTLFGAIISFISSDKFGRKPFLFWAGVLFLVAVIGTALSTDVYFFSVHRFLGGCAMGMFSIAAPIYITEISPDYVRGRSVGLFQLNIIIGVIIAIVASYLVKEYYEFYPWRVLYGLVIVLTIVFLTLILNIPESPRWLFINRKEDERVLEIFKELDDHSKKNYCPAFKSLIDERNLLNGNKIERAYKLIGTSLYFVVLILFFNLFSGLWLIIYYSPDFIGFPDFDLGDSLGSLLILGGTGLIFTVLGLFVIDKIGRKRLMFIGSSGTITGLLVIILGYWTGTLKLLGSLGILTFIASYSVGQGIVFWVFISEIFPNRLRIKGYSIVAAFYWGVAAFLSFLVPKIIQEFSPTSVFMISLVSMFLQLIFVIFLMPETNRKPLEIIPPSLPP